MASGPRCRCPAWSACIQGPDEGLRAMGPVEPDAQHLSIYQPLSAAAGPACHVKACGNGSVGDTAGSATRAFSVKRMRRELRKGGYAGVLDSNGTAAPASCEGRDARRVGCRGNIARMGLELALAGASWSRARASQSRSEQR
jgi:hypothetical protein